MAAIQPLSDTGAFRFDAALIARHDRAGPRYTSYPTALEFDGRFDLAAYRRQLERLRSEQPPRPLSLYFHLPFCATICYYCACNKVVTANRSRLPPYLARLERELALHAEALPTDRVVEQLHWGGGTPTYLSGEQMRALMAATRRAFTLADDANGEYSIEIDPRTLAPDTLPLLRELGFNRLSLGVQDFDPAVQRAVNRLQDEAITVAAVEGARQAGFRSVSVDLIYGLPLQTPASFARTVERVVALAPDRLSVFNYAHLPQRFKSQRQIDETTLPAPADKLLMLQQTGEALVAAGYRYIGMDHFALPGDELAVAQREHRLHRNFQGYSTHDDCHLVGLGVTAIGALGDSYYQNVRDIADYTTRLDRGALPIERGIELTADDKLRRHVISELICHFELNFAAVEGRFGIEFPRYFAAECARLEGLAGDGLLELDRHGLRVTGRGRLLIRNVCMVFDRYLAAVTTERFSRVL